MLNGILCTVRHTHAEEIVDTDLLTILEEHPENFPGNITAKNAFSIIAKAFCNLGQWKLFD
jgi:hypothetical protein